MFSLIRSIPCSRALPALWLAMVLVAVATVPLSANTPVPAASRGNASQFAYQLRFTVFSQEAGSREFVLVENDWVSEPFKIPNSRFGSRIGVPSEGFTLALKGGDGRLVPVSRITLPEEGRAFLILLLPSEQAGSVVNAVVIRADDPAFKPGDIQFFNLSDSPVGVRMAEERALLPSGIHRKVSAPDLPEEVSSYPVEFYTEDASGRYLFAASTWLNQKHMRTYVFTYRSPENGRMVYRAIDEFTSWLR